MTGFRQADQIAYAGGGERFFKCGIIQATVHAAEDQRIYIFERLYRTYDGVRDRSDRIIIKRNPFKFTHILHAVLNALEILNPL